MKVIANRIGYFGHRRRPEGSVFIIPDKPTKKDGSPRALGDWMTEVKDPSVPVKDARAGDAEAARKAAEVLEREQGGGEGASEQDVI